MLLLLPPSEGKATPARGKPVELESLAFADTLGPLRERLIAAVDPDLLGAHAARAAKVYTGVLFGQLDFASLPAPARRRANQHVLIASGLWGLLRPTDRIPAYKLPIGDPAPAVGNLATAWRPKHATLVEVRAFRENPDGTRQPISHMAKATRGLVARAVLTAPKLPGTPEGVLTATAAANLDAELHPASGPRRWTLDVLECA